MKSIHVLCLHLSIYLSLCVFVKIELAVYNPSSAFSCSPGPCELSYRPHSGRIGRTEPAMFRFVLLALVLCSADLGSELREAAKQGDAAKVKELLVKGADPDDKELGLGKAKKIFLLSRKTGH